MYHLFFFYISFRNNKQKYLFSQVFLNFIFVFYFSFIVVLVSVNNNNPGSCGIVRVLNSKKMLSWAMINLGVSHIINAGSHSRCKKQSHPALSLAKHHSVNLNAVSDSQGLATQTSGSKLWMHFNSCS